MWWDTATFSLPSGLGDNGSFNISGTTLRANASFDYETKSSYIVTVRVTDSGGLTFDKQFPITIINLDDTAPTITSGSTAAAIDENSGAGQVVYTVKSDDTADISGGVTTYSLGTFLDESFFVIDDSTGRVQLRRNPNYEVKPSYLFEVMATDRAGNASRKTVSLSINNVNDPPTGSVKISGTAIEGQTLTASNTLDDEDGLGDIHYQWQAGGTPISGAMGSTYVLKTAEIGKTISVVASYIDRRVGSGTYESVSSAPTAIVAASPPPVVLASSMASLNANATTLTITGSGFSTAAASNLVTFSGAAGTTTGTVMSATATKLTVRLNGTLTGGALYASVAVTVKGVTGISSDWVQVATVNPVVTSSTTSIFGNTTSLTIRGFGFDATASNNVVTFSDNTGTVIATGTVTSATATSLTVTNLTGQLAGALYASVSTNQGSSTTAIQVANVTPVVTSSTSNLPADSTTLTIYGFGFTSATSGTTGTTGTTVTLTGGTVVSVTVVSSTQLTVTVSNLLAGSLTAVVKSSNVSSGTAVQVATVSPVIVSSTMGLKADSKTVTITGFGFSTAAANDVVTFTDANGATFPGTVQSGATATSMTVNLSGTPSGGALNASVKVKGVGSGTAVQVATVTPVITTGTTILSAGTTISSTMLVITGSGFSTAIAFDIVTLTDANGATFSGTVQPGASTTKMTVKLTDLTGPLPAGALNASVTVNGVSSAAAVQVAIVNPAVTVSATPIAADATSLTINGVGFDATNPGNNVVTFSGNAGTVTGTVTSATATTLTVSMSGQMAGVLKATVSTNGHSSGPSAVQVAIINPVVTSSTSTLSADAMTLVINGVGFTSGTKVTLTGGTAGTVTFISSTQLKLPVSNLVGGPLMAVAISSNVSSGTQVQVATVSPVITMGTTILNAGTTISSTMLVITGSGFSTAIAFDIVTLTDANGATFSGTVQPGASTTKMTVKLTGLTGPLPAGALNASVTVNGVSSAAAVQVAIVNPAVTVSATPVAADATSLTINGVGFDATNPGNNVVTFSGNAGTVTGTVTSATATTLTVSMSGQMAGVLKATVSTNGHSSGPSAVQVAIINPVVTSSTSTLSADAMTLVINGVGFTSGTKVTLTGGTAGTVTFISSTQLKLPVSNLVGGPLMAVAISSNVSSGTQVQVATVSPVINTGTNILSVGTTTSSTMLAITGSGFSTAISLDIVTLTDANGATFSGTVQTGATTTKLTVKLTGLTGKLPSGQLKASITVNGVSCAMAVQVATLK